MDVAALSLQIDSSSVVKAANDLDRFSAAAAKAGSSSGSNSGSIAKLVATVQSMDSKLGSIVSALDRLAAANDNVASSSKAATTALNTVSGSLKATMGPMSSVAASAVTVSVNFSSMGAAAKQADAHVQAFRANIAAAGPALQQADAHVQAFRNSLAKVPPAAAAASAGVATSAGALKANTGNIAAQVQDIGVTAAMGMSPLLIALQQGTQLSAVFAQSGGSALATIRGAFASILNPTALLTIALVAGAAALIQWAMSAVSASGETDKLSKAIDQTKITTYALGDAQTALGGVIDLTTGKIKSQSAALAGLARAQLEMIRATALRDRAEASKTISDLRGRNTPTIDTRPGAGMGVSPYSGIALSGRTSTTEQQRLLDQFTSGKLTSTQAIDGMEKLRKVGKLTEDQFIRLTGAVASFGVAGENLKVYDDARKALGGDKGALEQFLDRPKTSKGGKSDAEKLVDIYASAQADIAAEKARALAEANELGAMETARLEKQTALLNSIHQKGIPITDDVRKKVTALAEAYAQAKVDADVSKALNATTDGIERQREAVADQVKLIGLYGDALARASRELQAQRQLRDSLPKGEVVVAQNLTGALSDDIEAASQAARIEKIRKDSEDAAYALDLERQGIGLTGAAAESYAYVVDRLNAAKREGIELSPAEVAAIKAAGDAYGAQRYAIDQQKQAIADAREVTKGFFTDWINGVREGGNLFKSFADSVVNSLNKIIDKLLDKTLNSFLDSMFSGSSSGGGLFGGLFGKGAGGTGSANIPDFTKGWDFNPVMNALGGAYGTAQRFANGGAFTNSIISTPTLFRFANGAALGEMGEAGPEAVMPLKRGPNGALGVQMHGGGKSSIRMGDIHNTYKLDGAIGADGIAAMVRQGGEATYNQVKRDLQTLLAQLDTDGTFAS